MSEEGKQSSSKAKIKSSSDVNRRKGHRAYVSKQINIIQDILSEENYLSKKSKLLSLKGGLERKIPVLIDLDELILEQCSEDSVEEEIIRTAEIQDEIQEILFELNTKLNLTHTENNNETSVVPKTEGRMNSASTRLPKFVLPEFRGNPLEWQSFWDSFKASVDDTGIDDVTKFNYLKSVLKGPAASAISGLTLTSENYAEAIDILSSRYGNKQLIISSHMEKLLSISAVISVNDVTKVRSMYDELEIHVRNLKSLNIDAKQYSPVLISIVMSKLPVEIKLVVSRIMPPNEEWDVDELLYVLKREVESREMCHLMSSTTCSKSDTRHTDRYRPGFTAAALVTETRHQLPHESRREYSHGNGYNKSDNRRSYSCVFCKREHAPSRCDVITDVKARKSILRNTGRCFICLKTNHLARECKATYRCARCNQRHNVSICEPRAPAIIQPNNEITKSTGMTVTFKEYARSSSTLLQTAQAIVSDNLSTDNSKRIRVLMDDGAQKSFITEEVMRTLDLPVIRKEKVIVNGFGDEEGSLQQLKIVSPILFNVSKTDYRKVELYVVPLICSPILEQNVRVAKETYDHLSSLPLADDTEGTEGRKIDVLIGGNFYWKFVSGKVLKGETEPVAVETIFGWTLSGSMVKCDRTNNMTIPSKIMLTVDKRVEDEKLHELLKKFWTLESIGINDDVHDCSKNNDILDKFERDIKFNGSNYVAKLPWKPGDFIISDNFAVARARLYSLLRRLRKTPGTLEKYDQIVKDQQSEGIIEEIPSAEATKTGSVYYMPHREVIREDKETTKIRMVYDPRSKAAGPSLNECLEAGPCLLPKIFDLLVRFRSYRYGMISDIKSAFLNIRISPEDRDYLRFLWVDDIRKDEPVVVSKRLTSVVFGINCGPFLLGATISHHMRQYNDIDPELVEQFLADLYMDDSISGADDEEKGYRFYLFSKILMKEGGFMLRKWATNNPQLQNRINDNEAALGEPEMAECATDVKKVLGVDWDVGKDQLLFSFSNIFSDDIGVNDITKRHVLKIISSIFDPLGFLGPTVVNLKLMFQELCALKCSWDEPLDPEFNYRWKRCVTKLRNFESIRVPRFYVNGIDVDDSTIFELHAFADASKKAYAGVVYLRIITNNNICTRFIAAKTRIAPLNEETIPKLELLACLILSRLVQTVTDTLRNIRINKICCWTDSMDCFYWINSAGKVWKRFVQNRVREIRKNVPDIKWLHCPGKLNPADIPSRGGDTKTDKSREFWLYGPEMLNSRDLNLNVDDEKFKNLCDEYAKTSTMFIKTESEKILVGGIGEIVQIDRFSYLERLLLSTSYVLRFIYNCLNKDAPRTGDITIAEINESESMWIKYTQSSFDAIYLNGVQCSLGAFKDDSGIIKVKGRFEYAEMECKIPILLPKNNAFSRLIILRAHEAVKHSGMKDTLNEIRKDYWVINGRSQVRKVIKSCFLCKKQSCKPFGMMPSAPLPDFRVKLQHPFANTGVDYIGPLYVYATPGKGVDHHKVHIVLFTCAATRAVSLDLVPDASSYEFTLCMKRFINRRGIPKLFISDNAKCFMGPEAKGFLRRSRCNWKFILEKSPWWGGFWERLVQTVKRSLRKTLGKGTLRYGELLTAIIEIEGIMNSRPLCYLYSDQLDNNVITPSHLMHGRRIFNFHSDDLLSEENNVSLTKRLKHLQTVMDQMRNRWKKEYLTELREYHSCKNNVPEKQAKVGDVVFVEDKKMPRVKWKLGIIIRLISSKDGHIRGCRLKVSDNGRISEIQRPVNHLYYFEVSSTPVDFNTVPNETSEVIAVPVDDVLSPSVGRVRRNAAVVGELKRKNCEL